MFIPFATRVPTVSPPIGILGFSKTEWGPLALPLDAGQFGLTGCTLYVSVDATFLM